MGAVAIENLRLFTEGEKRLRYVGFGTHVHTCDHPNVKKADQRRLPISTAVTAGDLQALDTKAWRVLDKHFGAHRAAMTLPCLPIVDEAQVIFRGPKKRTFLFPIGHLSP